MGPCAAYEHRSVAASLNYLVVDRVDIQFATKELARTMARPIEGDVLEAKKIGRYLRFDWCDHIDTLSLYSDSDSAGGRNTRKSTSGGVLMFGGHLIKTYARQQRTIALSSAEAELYALVAASAEALAMAAYASDLGIVVKPSVHTDASAALCIAQRRGLGKVRHVRTQALWVQQAYAEKQLEFHKVPGT